MRFEQRASHLANVVVVVGKEDGRLIGVVVFFKNGLQLRSIGLCCGGRCRQDKRLRLSNWRLFGGRCRRFDLQIQRQMHGKHRWSFGLTANADVPAVHVYEGFCQG